MFEEKERFAKRLISAVDERRGTRSDHGRKIWLHAQLPFKITPKGVGKWLDAETMPTAEHAPAVAQALGVGTAWLMFGEGPRYAAGESLGDNQDALYRIETAFRRGVAVDEAKALAYLAERLAQKT